MYSPFWRLLILVRSSHICSNNVLLSRDQSVITRSTHLQEIFDSYWVLSSYLFDCIQSTLELLTTETHERIYTSQLKSFYARGTDQHFWGLGVGGVTQLFSWNTQSFFKQRLSFSNLQSIYSLSLYSNICPCPDQTFIKTIILLKFKTHHLPLYSSILIYSLYIW